ncbi:MAG: universal stress protein [Alphaproteobacteria bacterium]|nr:universal stress protein [Alphaproteobacteria bacterium]MBU0801974.1 universal stress protein [Alphaproteobacteria bacterium]MBU0872419.1 universal stress protein [Alphaproteobacteria bacterium]MBU1399473.1 universal stress protein [Alphaproteobacteria bacterium]MBU1589859.1 universal stress protein [Alphaproteobacteria bacterium]
MSKLIALVDGSIYARSVCDHAAWIAGRTGQPVELLHVLGRRETASVPSDLSGSIALGARTALLSELATLDEQRAKLAQKRGRAILDDAKAAVEEDGVGDVTTRLRIGDLVETVAEMEKDAAMLVIGKRGEGADFAKLHLGSNLERVVRAMHKPVFVASRAFKPVERFVIAYDGGASANRAVDCVAKSAMLKGLPCTLLSVGADTAENRSRLDAPARILRDAGYTVEALLLQGDPDEVIGARVESEHEGLLVMGAYGHSRIRSLVIGSTTSAMVRRCKIPVLLIR